MKFREIYFTENDTSFESTLNNLKSEIVTVAQKEYDAWANAENEEWYADEYAGGGICHLIADRIIEVIFDKTPYEAQTMSHSEKQHVSVIVKSDTPLDEESDEYEIMHIDIPPSIYETGGGFTWKRIPDVEFDKNDIVLYPDSMSQEDWEDFNG